MATEWVISLVLIALLVGVLITIAISMYLVDRKTIAGLKELGFEGQAITMPKQKRPDFAAMKPESVARPVNPDDPPRWVTYSPTGDRHPPFCQCHGDPLERGERVLLWPVPNSGGRVDLFHEDGLEIIDRDEA